MCVCVYVGVGERESKREGGRERDRGREREKERENEVLESDLRKPQLLDVRKELFRREHPRPTQLDPQGLRAG